MRNKANFLWVALSLVFIVIFNISVFLTISSFTITFWISYEFIHISYILLLLSLLNIPKVKNPEVLGYPLVYISGLYFICAFIAGIVFILFKNAKFTVAFIPQLIIAGIYVFIYITNLLANESTKSNMHESQNNIFFIRNAASELNLIMQQITDDILKKKIEKLYDAVRSSQVKSYPELALTEQNILQKIEELKKRIYSEDYSQVNIIIERIQVLLSERNSKIINLR